jgi:acid phosphatase
MFGNFTFKIFLFVFLLLFPSAGSASKSSLTFKDNVQFIALGDQGAGGKGQKKVAEAMNRKATKDPVNFVILLGDNFYYSGVDSIDDPQWNDKFEKMYAYPSLQIPFYAILGNHGYWGNPAAQVQYTKKSSRWEMPANYYTFTAIINDSIQVQFIALDTTPIVKRKPDSAYQIKWLDEQLRKSKAHWKIIYGHHIVFSSGYYGTNKHLVKVLAPIFREYGVDLYMSGHDHHLELIKSDSGLCYIISGTGSKTRSVRAGKNTLFASSHPGFAWIKISREELIIQFITVNGGIEYEHKIEKIWRKK